ncbi:hypothetical protein ACPCSQ_07170 [Streptomyces griseoincarnatus]|uniref:hypothetical protein n=1 Tax=Streptomyces sp. SMS_SU21 TaxID=2069440 RepID=UPI000C8842B9|nr:hypothetical protein [Streptomyces sp. SMS_SU21]MCA2204643.1 DUF748 domain-containing protein [Streptomyces sp. SMS_SU21]NEA94573.1 DUF748 domain-containing protein [Actinospica acidiphila]
MKTGLRITAFAAALAGAFGTAYGVGQAFDPVVAERPWAHEDRHPSGAGESEHGGSAAHAPGGLQISEGGYTLDLDTPTVTAGEPAELRFTVRDADGRAVGEYRREHDKELHLIVASRDLVTYRHLHPERAPDGTWSTPVDLPRAGGYRVFADFTPGRPGAENLTLGADLAASGSYSPRELPRPSATARVDGYDVKLTGTLTPGRASELRLTVSRDGEPVTDLQPYLGAYGHLVALRAGDLAYLHVHPEGEPGDGATRPGPHVSFTATAPSSGSYRLFLDFQHDGVVRTAAFTVETGQALAEQAPTSPGPAESPGHSDDGHGH